MGAFGGSGGGGGGYGGQNPFAQYGQGAMDGQYAQGGIGTVQNGIGMGGGQSSGGFGDPAMQSIYGQLMNWNQQNPQVGQYAQGGMNGFGSYFGGGPLPPNYAAAAEQTANGNRVNQSNPWGSSTWSQDPTTHQWSQSTSLNPQLQGALDAQQGMQNQRSQAAQGMFGSALGDLQKGIDWNGLPQVGNGQDAMKQAQDASYNQESSRLDPQWNQRQEQMRAQLANQGLDPGSQAYQQQMDSFSRDRNDAYQGAMNNSIGLGNQAAQQQFGMNMQARQQGLGEQQMQQYGGLNAMNALMQGQGVQNPQFAGYNQGPNYLGAAGMQYGADQGRYENQQKSWSDLFSGVGGLGKGLFGFF